MAELQPTISAPVDDEAVLDYTQVMRRKMVAELCKGGMPSSDEDRKMTLQLLDGLDRAALTNKRIKSDEKTANKESLAQTIVAELLKSVPRNAGISYSSDREIPMLGNEVPEPETVPGELDQNSPESNYAEFMKKFAD